MKTDDLIKAIAAGRRGERAARWRCAWLVALGIGGLIAMRSLFALDLGVRPDIGSALQTWRFAGKVVIALSCFRRRPVGDSAAGRPDAEPRTALAALSLPMLAAGARHRAGSWRRPRRAPGLPAPSAATPGFAWRRSLCCRLRRSSALLVALRAGAPRSPAMAGAAAGLLAGGLGAVLYAIHCADDSPLFVALWYVPAVALVVLAGAAAGSRVLRW